MSHPNIPKDKARPWLAGEVQEPDDEDWSEYPAWAMPGDEQQPEQRSETK